MPYSTPKRVLKTALAGFGALALMGTALSAIADEESTSLAQVLKSIDQSIAQAKKTRGPGEPALWVMRDEDTTVYIFGSVHILPANTKWQSARVNKAFDAADQVIFEVDSADPNAQANAQALVQQYGLYSDGGSLTKTLNDKDEAIVRAGAEKIGFSMAQVDIMKPWLVSLQMGLVQPTQAGYTPQEGVEVILLAKAQKAGKTINYLESADSQLRVLSGASEAQQIESLVILAQTIERGTEILDLVVEEWRDGDVKGIAALVSNSETAGTGTQYEDLIVNRNRNWVPQIEALLDQPGTMFVAVGAGHLAGPDSVINMLKAKGHKVSGPQ